MLLWKSWLSLGKGCLGSLEFLFLLGIFSLALSTQIWTWEKSASRFLERHYFLIQGQFCLIRACMLLEADGERQAAPYRLCWPPRPRLLCPCQ
jgi:hypothetical protein